jgi:hypothetical protein
MRTTICRNKFRRTSLVDVALKGRSAAAPRRFVSTKRRGSQHAAGAEIPDLVRSAVEIDDRVWSQVAVVNIAVVADLLDDLVGEVVR